MDTRSVIRSRRQSARLKSQPRHDTDTKHFTSNRRVSDTKVSTNKPISKKVTVKRVQFTGSSPKAASPAGIPETSGTVKCLTKGGDGVAASPMFPNLHSIEATCLYSTNMEERVGTANPEGFLAEASENAGTGSRGGRAGARGEKAANGALRLVEDTPPNVSNGKRSPSQEPHSGDGSSLPDSRRRSARLARTPGLEDLKTSVTDIDHRTTQPSAAGRKIVKTSMEAGLATDTMSFVAEKSQHTPQRTCSATSSGSSLSDIDELPSHDSISFARSPANENDSTEMASPIPELVADIERIIETSSPITARASGSNKRYASSSEKPSESPVVTTYATSTFAPESAHDANHQTEVVYTQNHDSWSMSPTTTEQFLPRFTSAEASDSKFNPKNHLRIGSSSRKATRDKLNWKNCQEDSPHGIKRGADEMSHDEHISTREKQSSSSSPRVLAPAFPRTINLIESASSRDCYDIDDDELDSPGRRLWVDGETGAAFRTSWPREESNQNLFQADFRPHVGMSSGTATSGASNPIYSPRPHHHTSPSHTTEQNSEKEEHSPTVPEHVASSLSSSSEPHDTRCCGDCGKTPRKYLVCARCLKTRYCGKYCQIWNWPIHRQVCGASEEAGPGECKKQEDYLVGMWDGALRLLQESVVDRQHATDVGVMDQAALQSDVGGSFMGRRTGENIVEQGVRLLAGGALTGGDGAGRQERGMGGDEGVADRRDGADQHSRRVAEEEEKLENEAESDDCPSTPESMFQSRAKSLRLAQAQAQAQAQAMGD